MSETFVKSRFSKARVTYIIIAVLELFTREINFEVAISILSSCDFKRRHFFNFNTFARSINVSQISRKNAYRKRYENAFFRKDFILVCIISLVALAKYMNVPFQLVLTLTSACSTREIVLMYIALTYIYP